MKIPLLRGFMISLAAATVAIGGQPKPVPRIQAIPEPDSQVSFLLNGVPVTRLHYRPDQNRPFLYPLMGPSGFSLTRMGHPRDPESHSHHNSIWISHHSVDGVSFWEDRGGNRIVHQRVLRFEDSDTEAFVETENAWLAKDGTKVLREFRRITLQSLPENSEYLLVIDIQLEAPGAKDVTLGETPFGLIGVRMAKTIGVADGGGTIRNSEGGIDEAGCFRKPARWCDYSGPITPNATEGVTLMDHPMNPNHPVPFHVRNDGWMGAAVTFPGAIVIKVGEPLRLRYGLYVHGGEGAPDVIQRRWSEFSQSKFRDFVVKR
jgi:hypothetical protein